MRQGLLSTDKQTRLGNTTLVNYGIQTEQSDLRAHVCVLARKVYVYKTPDGVNAISKLPEDRIKPTYTGEIMTAKGFPIPITKIEGIAEVSIPDTWLDKVAFSPTESTTVKGEKAVKIVKGLLKTGRFPLLPVEQLEITDTDMQIKGTDIEVSMAFKVSIQVKCDYKGGIGKPGCTGNLYLQTAECNPYGYT